MTAARATTHRPPLGLVLLALLLLTLLAKLPEMLGTLFASRPLIVRIHAISVVAYFLHQRLQGRFRPWVATIFVAALPVVLILTTTALMGSLAGLPPGRVQQVTAIAFIVCTFNLGAVLFAGATPLDGRRTLRDGRRLLGDGKTVRGAGGGLLLATVIGLTAGTGLAAASLIAGSAMAGDLLGSFAKRRLGRKRGAPLLLLDQLDALLPLALVEWRWHFLDLNTPAVAALAAAVFVIQLAGNYILYRMGKKTVPW